MLGKDLIVGSQPRLTSLVSLQYLRSALSVSCLVLAPMPGPSVLEHSRYHGLTIDARSENLTYALAQVESYAVPHNTCPDGLDECPPSDRDKILREEKQQLTRGAAHLLFECMRIHSAPHWTSILDLERCNETQRLKLEMPLLSSNHQDDMRWFTKGIELPKLTRNFVATHSPLDTTVDEPFDILEECESQIATMLSEINNERPEINVEAVKLIAKCKSPSWTQNDLDELVKEELSYRKVLSEHIQYDHSVLTLLDSLTQTLDASAHSTRLARRRISTPSTFNLAQRRASIRIFH